MLHNENTYYINKKFQNQKVAVWIQDHVLNSEFSIYFCLYFYIYLYINAIYLRNLFIFI